MSDTPLCPFCGSTIDHDPIYAQVRKQFFEHVRSLEHRLAEAQAKLKQCEEALVKCKLWHQGDKWRFGPQHEHWQEQMNVIDAALSSPRARRDE